MDTEHIFKDAEERERAIRYSRIREWLVLAGVIWNLLEGLGLLASGLSAGLRDRSERLAPRRLGPAMPFVAMMTAVTFVTSLPLSFLSDYVVEHRFGLSNQSVRAWLLDQLKGLAVGIGVGLPMAQGVYWIIRRWPQRWWAVLSALTVPLSILMVNLAPVLIMPLFNKFIPLKDEALAKRIKDLAASEGVHVSDVLQMDMSKQTKKANAFFTGIGNTKRIVMGDTMLEEFTPDELEVVLAHELGHQVHRDIWKLIALSAPTSVIGFLAAHVLTPRIVRRWGERWGLDTERPLEDVAALPLLTLTAGLALQLVTPAMNAISRNYVEHPADTYALDLTGNREAFIGAMEKLGRMNLSNPSPSALVKYLLYSHPPLAERIAYGRSYTPEG